MLRFYKHLSALVTLLFVFSGLVIYLCIFWCSESLDLQPPTHDTFQWRPVITSDSHYEGASHYRVENAAESINYQFELDPNIEFPYVSFALRFIENEKNKFQHIDLSEYHTLRFRVACVPANILTFTLNTFDPLISNPDNLLSYRIPSTYFDCSPTPSIVEIDLNRLEIPEWWLRHHTNLANRSYSLKEIASISFSNSGQSPRAVPSQVRIDNAQLLKRNFWLLAAAIVLLVCAWGAGLCWMLRAHAKALSAQLQLKLQRDAPLIAYQQLSVESHRDKERSALITYLATEYHNPELDLEKVSLAVGINKSKINETLKQELGMTFVSYLNKLRLTEAARLLRTNQELSISEAAFTVGYNNPSYFNRLFKNEYGCTPKEFRKLIQIRESELPES
jgi:AraC-like DNA-binding protein